MKNTSLKTKAGALAGFLVLLIGAIILVSPPESAADSSKHHSRKSLQGSWTTQLQRIDCQTGAPVALPGHGLITFAADDTLTETAAGAAPGFRGPGHGVWDRRGRTEYTATFVLQLLNPDGSFAAWLKSMQVIELSDDGDEFTSMVSTEVRNAQGVVIATGCATTVGTRIE